MTIVGRSQLDHPSLGAAGGSALHASIETLYSNIGNDVGARYDTAASIANSAVTVIDHNFGIQFADLKINLYTGTHPNLVRVADPVASGWVIAATAGFLKTKIDVTAPSSGGPHTFAVLTMQSRGSEKLKDLDDINFSVAPIDGQFLIYDTATSKWLPAYLKYKSEPATIITNAITPATGANTQRITTGAADLQMINSPVDGKVLVLVNETGSDFLIKNDTGATAANRFYTGTGEDFTFKNQSAVSAIYNSTLSRWMLTGGAASSSASGLGKKNYITSANKATGWITGGATVTVTTETTSANLPDQITQSTGIAITRVSGTTGYAAYRFEMDRSDYGKKFEINFDQKSAFTTEGYQVQAFAGSVFGTYGTQLTVQTAALTALTGPFVTTIDMPGAATPFIEFRIVATGSAGTAPFYANNVYVGPGVTNQGAAISDWVSYTPTYSGLGTVVSDLSYKRSGSDMHIMGHFVVGTVSGTQYFTLPSGLTLDSARIASAKYRSLGTIYLLAATGTYVSASETIASIYDGTNTDRIAFCQTVGAGTTGLTTGNVISSNRAATIPLLVIPISQWAGSGTVNLGAGAQTQYLYNSATGTATDSTSFAYGPLGTLVPQSALAGSITRRVRSQYPIQVGSFIELQASTDLLNWVAVGQYSGGIIGYTGGNANDYGMGWNRVSGSTTDIDITFGRYRTIAGTWDAAGNDWGGTRYWRLFIANPSSPVGFGPSSITERGLNTLLYHYHVNDNGASGGTAVAEASFYSVVVPYTAIYTVMGTAQIYTGTSVGNVSSGYIAVKTGSATYASATYRISQVTVQTYCGVASQRGIVQANALWTGLVNAGDTIHYGFAQADAVGTGGHSSHFFTVQEVRRS